MPANTNASGRPVIDKCKRCNGACCRYITVQMPTPGSMEEFDGLLWQMYHRDIKLFKDVDGWHLLIYTPCLNLAKNGRCTIYDDRPNVCRRHTSEHCEYDESITDSAALYFDDAAALDAYCAKRYKGWRRRLKKK
jgi:Fe-S-cluster containining protein